MALLANETIEEMLGETKRGVATQRVIAKNKTKIAQVLENRSRLYVQGFLAGYNLSREFDNRIRNIIFSDSD